MSKVVLSMDDFNNEENILMFFIGLFSGKCELRKKDLRRLFYSSNLFGELFEDDPDYVVEDLIKLGLIKQDKLELTDKGRRLFENSWIEGGEE